MEQPTSPRVIVIGAGFGGLAVAHHLRAAGITDITLLERSDDVGGVWRDNTYPGAACDVPSVLYSWSFARKSDWSHRYARQPEILDYIRDHAARSGLRDLVRTGAEVTGAAWDDATARWTVTLATGEELTSDVLVSAVGQLSRPAVPRIPGLDDFDGPIFHSATWDHDVDLTGKRVGVIGTGASAIQFVPAIAGEVASLTVFQRSAPYVVPKPDGAYSTRQQRRFAHHPRLHHLTRRGVFHLSEQLNRTLDSDGRLAVVLEKAWQLNLRRHVKDADLRAKLVPDYPLGCKRLLFSNDWYPTLAQPHVDVVTDGVADVEPDGIRTADGTLHELDVVILGTGFAATEFLAPMEITGRGGRRLAEAWEGGARAHLGITVPDFPGFYVLYGPNTNLGGSSIIGMLEAQAGYVVRAALETAARRAPLVVRADRAAAYDEEMQRRLDSSVWSSCTSWYREPGGRITTNWPGTVAEYQQRTSAFDPSDFETVAVAAR
ncbi:cation diffusion facilitator CzcD-associated flavoprotein CzcO [Nocardioides aromaticivorans]|uniref:Cation diffusion facilitator CzcD-associated flavoprotein CzcO n=1 Tax=Nocardioides aromaticivorans TaxID=200618 RepID=A0A7Y9ZKX9_9ACTN|nr:NAD(P)/FAD-dependent oxidoreductase [Nocardioides aromaticivorans]NYI47367.1 cation diffusion facilitator CzcD-associated flavoprotein CzcO [Nocardioides aromaticivorans]